MITININPIVFSIGPFDVRWYGIMVFLAVVAVIALAILEARRVGLSEDHIYNVALWAIIGGILVSRLLHVIDKWDYYMANPRQIIGFEGLTVYGAVLGAMVAVLIYCRVKKISFWQMGDIIAPGAIVGQAIGRIGCLLNGCCYGLPASLPWGVVYTNPASFCPLGESFQPTQIYHILWDLIGFGILWSVRRRLEPKGSLFLLYLAIYAAGDLSIRFVRVGEPFRSGLFFNLQQAQLIGILVLLVTVPWLIIRMWRYRAKQSAAASVKKVSRRRRNRGA
ncbi:MAG: prolipoprotein diacylglyceryl transferase [Dehalococcoidia bacterium]|nr:prolipoprotein diacylglyceryl transferase [Dehalococcoidia bacterium]